MQSVAKTVVGFTQDLCFGERCRCRSRSSLQVDWLGGQNKICSTAAVAESYLHYRYD